MSRDEITRQLADAYASDADRHDAQGRHRIAEIYRNAAARERAKIHGRQPETFGDPADAEFIPTDHNDANGVQTMRDFQ